MLLFQCNISGNVTCSDMAFIDVAAVILEPLMLKRDVSISLWLGCTWISLVGLNRSCVFNFLVTSLDDLSLRLWRPVGTRALNIDLG